MATPKKTTNLTAEQEYKKELRRIKQFITRASKRGFVWLDDPVPKQPKKITSKSVERLRRITPETLYKKSKFVDTETGELISGNKARRTAKKTSKTTKPESEKQATPKTKKETHRKSRKKTETKPEKKTKTKSKKKNKPKSKKETPSTPISEAPNVDTEDIHSDNYYPSFVDIVLSNFHAQLAQFPNAEGTPLLLAWFDTLIADNGREAVAQMLQDGAEQGILITWETVYKSVNTKTYMTEMMRYLPDQGNYYTDQIMDMMEQFEWWEQPE